MNISFECKDNLKFILKSIDKSSKVLYEKDDARIKNFKNLTFYFKSGAMALHDAAASSLGGAIPNEILELLVQKVFPYSYLDSFNMLESAEYPKYESFYDNLKDRNVDFKEYERVKKLWDYF